MLDPPSCDLILVTDDLGIYPVRIYLSAYMTSLNAPGFSFSILNVSAAQQRLHAYTPPGATQLAPVSITDLLDDSTDALAWIGVRSNWPTKGKDRLSRLAASSAGEAPLSSRTDIVSKWNLTDMSPEMVKGGIVSACEAVLGVEKELTEYDTVLGDGDCGETFSAGAQGKIVYWTVNYWLTFYSSGSYSTRRREDRTRRPQFGRGCAPDRGCPRRLYGRDYRCL